MADRRRGDAEVLRLRFDEAAAQFEGEDLARVGRLALRFGRYRTAKKLGVARSEKFLREQALPMVPIGREAGGFFVDESVLAEIAAELNEPLPALLGATVRLMRARGSLHAAKLYVLARLSGDSALIEEAAPAFFARAAHPRRALAAEVSARFSVEQIQVGDDDDYNPKSAFLFAGREIVIKENLRLHLDPSEISGYSREREILQPIDHPRVVKLREVTQIEHHELLILSRAPGQTLDGTRLPADQARRVGAQLAELLARLHARGILYLDVKPRNLIFDGRDVTLCDFGMARAGERVTSMLSTLEYVPPEMAREFVATSASDVFQLGIVLHQLFTGRHPFSDGEGADVALANLWDEPHLLAEPELLGAMLKKRPEERPSARAVWERLS